MIYWFTGLPGAGKSVLASALAYNLRRHRRNGIVHLDGESLRFVTCNPDYSEEGRRRNVATMQRLASVLADQGLTVVVSMVSPFRDQREQFKQRPEVLEFYVHTTERRGKEQYHCAYEPPTERCVSIDTTNTTIADSVDQVWQAVLSMSVVI